MRLVEFFCRQGNIFHCRLRLPFWEILVEVAVFSQGEVITATVCKVLFANKIQRIVTGSIVFSHREFYCSAFVTSDRKVSSFSFCCKLLSPWGMVIKNDQPVNIHGPKEMLRWFQNCFPNFRRKQNCDELPEDCTMVFRSKHNCF